MLSFGPADDGSFDLLPNEIHVWRIPLVVDPLDRERLEQWLSAEELHRARRFVFERDQDRFVACRGRLRGILARYLRVEPQEIAFSYGEFGKPAVETLESPLYFNVSHSHDLALLGVRRDGEMGVDVERLRPIGEAQAIARRYFTPREHATLARLTGDELVTAFFQCWTHKEALLKALGVGIAFSLSEVEVDIESVSQPTMRSLNPARTGDLSSWRLFRLEPTAGYLGAIAAAGRVDRLLGWDWA